MDIATQSLDKGEVIDLVDELSLSAGTYRIENISSNAVWLAPYDSAASDPDAIRDGFYLDSLGRVLSGRTVEVETNNALYVYAPFGGKVKISDG